MTREDALNLLYSVISPDEFAQMINHELDLDLVPGFECTDEQARSLMLRIAIEISEDVPIQEE